MKHIQPVTVIFLLMFALSSCEKKDPEIPNQEELITTITYTLVPENGGNPVKFTYRDQDGVGGNEPNVSTEILNAGTTYSGTLTH